MLKTLFYHFTLVLDQTLRHLPSIGRFRPHKGTFSAVERLKKGELPGVILLESQQPGPCPPSSITDLAGMRQHDHQPWPAFWVRSDDARLVGSMLHWRDQCDLICLEGVFHHPIRRKIRHDRYFAQILVPEPQFLPGAWTSLGSNWGNGRNYFHWMLDALTRLWVRQHLPEPTRILLPSYSASYVTESLELLGLSHLAQTAPSCCVQPERFYFCSPTAMTGVWNPVGFNWLREKFAEFQSPQSDGKPIFLTRRGITRVPNNLSEIEEHFSSNGYQIIDCCMYSVKQQIHLASSAPAIAGLHGAAMTNLLWARPRTPVLELFTSGHLNACYEQISFQGKLNYHGCVLDGQNDLYNIARWSKATNRHLTNRVL